MPTSIYNALFTGSEPVQVTNVVTVITTVSITAALHSNRTILLSLSGGFTATLPAATGSGVTYEFMIGVVSATGYLIATLPTTDIYAGNIFVGIDNATTGRQFKTASNSNLITLNSTSTGGATIGDSFTVIDIQAGVWSVSGSVIGTSATTPFSHV